MYRVAKSCAADLRSPPVSPSVVASMWNPTAYELVCACVPVCVLLAMPAVGPIVDTLIERADREDDASIAEHSRGANSRGTAWPLVCRTT